MELTEKRKNEFIKLAVEKAQELSRFVEYWNRHMGKYEIGIDLSIDMLLYDQEKHELFSIIVEPSQTKSV